MTSVILITGASRGIGKGLVKSYLARADTVVIATVRDLQHGSVTDLHEFKPGPGSKLIVVKLDNSSDTDAESAIQELQQKHGIKNLDVVIANAGLGDIWQPIAVSTPSQAVEYFGVNAVGPMRLFLATLPLLSQSSTPRFVVMSSVLGSIERQSQFTMPDVVYGMSKAALNFFTGKVHHEHPNLIAFPIHPGWVQTDLGQSAATSFGVDKPPETLNDSVSGVIAQIDKSTREKTSGKLVGFDGEIIPW